jgi:hypothetical protein
LEASKHLWYFLMAVVEVVHKDIVQFIFGTECLVSFEYFFWSMACTCGCFLPSWHRFLGIIPEIERDRERNGVHL